MENDLNRFYVTMHIYKGDQEVHSVITPRSLIHEMFQKWKFPGSEFNVRVIDHTGNFRINSTILDPR
jgi:hypothetical protein